MVPGGAFAPFIAGEAAQVALHAAYGVASLGLLLFAIFLWFVTGNVLAPPSVWMLTMLSGVFGQELGLRAGDAAVWPEARYVVPLCVLSLGLAAAGGVCSASIRSRRTETDLRGRAGPVAGTVHEIRPAGDDAATDELSPEDLGRIRFLLDRALQPVGAYEGFEWIDQFQSAAVRYQLNFAGFALSLLQFTHLPAFGGYLTQAQANLIEKQRDPRIWRYWALENLWGNLRTGGNPFERDNVMFGGFCAAQIALFQAASNDLRFSAPGSFSLRGRRSETYRADFPTLVASMVGQHRRSHFGLIACEPNWIFPVCNSIGFAGIRHHDVRFGTHYWETESPRLRDLLENEFSRCRGALHYLPFELYRPRHAADWGRADQGSAKLLSQCDHARHCAAQLAVRAVERFSECSRRTFGRHTRLLADRRRQLPVYTDGRAGRHGRGGL